MSMPLSSMGLREYRWFWTTPIFCSLKQTTGRTATNGLSRSISRTASPFLMHTRFRRAVVILIKLLLNRGYIGALSSSDPYTLLLTFHKQKKYLVLASLILVIEDGFHRQNICDLLKFLQTTADPLKELQQQTIVHSVYEHIPL